MDKAFSPADIERRIYADWEASGYFAPSGVGPSYSIVIPPPNVTGALHLGHAINTTLQDILTRKARMEGKNALWIPGLDHAGIATRKQRWHDHVDMARDAAARFAGTAA